MMKRILKVSFFGLAGALLLGAVLGFIADESVPEGKAGPEAEALADKMLAALNFQAYDSIRVLEWSFPGGHHFVWNKREDRVEVKWKTYKVDLHLSTLEGSAWKNEVLLTGDRKENALRKAWQYFANDSFWLVAPYKIRDPGTERRLVHTREGPALLVTYTSGGVTPGDSYLWLLDENYLPKAWKLWVKIIPIGGLKFTWENWQTFNNAMLATLHKGPLITIELKNLKVE